MGKNLSKKSSMPLYEKNIQIISGMKILIIVALATVIFYPPYLQGLFFEKNIIPTSIFVFSLFIVFCIYKWAKNDYTMFKTPINYISLAFVVIYLISITVAVHTRSAIIELIKYCMYFAVFCMITDVAESKKTKLIFLWIITASAVGVSIIGLDSANGGNLVDILKKLFNSLGYQGNMFFGLFVENRINSTLQYPNALGSYVMAVYFVVIGLILSSKKRWIKVFGGICAYTLFLTLMLTVSRGAQLLFPVVLVIFIITSPKGHRINAAVHAVFLAVPAVCVTLVIGKYLSESVFSINVLLIMVIGSFFTALLSMLASKIGYMLQKINWKVYLLCFFLLIIILVVGINIIFNSSVPIQLSHDISEPDSLKLVSREIALTPGNDYTLSFTAEANMQEDKPYIYNVRISSKNKHDILFYGDTELVFQTYRDSSKQENLINFNVPDDSKIIRISFYNYYTGTSVTLNSVKIIDPRTSQTIREVRLKNKYGLDSVIEKFNNLLYDRSGLIRIIYYEDGMKIFSKKWFIGAGGGAWEYLYRQYQSYNYHSTQAHNYPLQLGIETGILGLLALVILIATLIQCYLKYYLKNSTKDIFIDSDKDVSSGYLYASIITAIASLFLHSIIDFDFSEASMLLLFWQLIAILSNEFKNKLTFNEMLPFSKKFLLKKKVLRGNGYGKTCIVISAVIAIVLLVFTVNIFQASSYAKKALNYLMQDNVDEAINSIIKAIEKDKYNERYVIGYNPVATRPDIKSGLADLLLIKSDSINRREQNGEKITQTELAQFQCQFALLNNYMKQIEKKADNNLYLSSNLASFNFSMGQIEKGIMFLNNSIKLFPFEPSIWKAKVNLYYQLVAQYFNAEDYDNTRKNLDIGLNIIYEAAMTNRENINPFTFDGDTINKLQMMQFINDYLNKKEDLSRLNEIVHYTIPYMDLNLDYVPDQWQSDNTELISLTTGKEALTIKATGGSFIYTKYPLRLEKDGTYFIFIELDRNIDSLSFEVTGITEKAILHTNEQNQYIGKFKVEKEPNENGNQLKLYLASDCKIKSILVYAEE